MTMGSHKITNLHVICLPCIGFAFALPSPCTCIAFELLEGKEVTAGCGIWPTGSGEMFRLENPNVALGNVFI